MLDAACIDFDSSGLTIDAACIDADGDVLASTAHGLAIDAACIDAETWPVPIDVVVQPRDSVVPPAGITIAGTR